MKFNKRTADDINEFFMAIKHGNLFNVKSFISNGLDVNYQNNNGWSPLMAASVAGQDTVLNCLVESGADVNLCRANDMSSPLLTAIELSKTSEEQCLKCVNILISAGANVNAADILGKTPLMAAAELNMAKIILVLLSVGANINLKDNNRKSAIVWSIEKENQDALKSLLEGPAAPRLGKDICHFAVNLSVELKNRYFAALIQKHITSSITEKDWREISEANIDAILAGRSDVTVIDCKNVAESHLFSWGLPHLIPLFRKHHITDDVLRYMTDTDFEKIEVETVYRTKIIQEIDTLFFKYKKEKLAKGSAMPGVTFAEAFAAVENMKEHFVFMYAMFGHHLKDKIIENPKQLKNRVENYTISDLLKICTQCTRNLDQLKDGVVALNNRIVDVDECEDESKRLCGPVYNFKMIKIVLSSATVMVVAWYIYTR